MGIDIQRDILVLKGQCVNQITLDEQEQQLVIHCRRDRRRNAIDPVTGKKGTINRYVRRQVRDVPLFLQPLGGPILTLNNDPIAYSYGECTGTLGGLCGTGISGSPIPNLFVISQPFHVPEPATLTLMGLGLAGLGYGRRRGRKAA